MAEALVFSAVATQVGRNANDIIRACTAAGFPAIAREGAMPHTLGLLAAATKHLVPNPTFLEGLSRSHALEGKYKSLFMSNFMGVQQPTIQQALVQEEAGRVLVLYVTSLAAAKSQPTVREMLREHITLVTDLKNVADIPDNVYHTCVHSATLKDIQKDVAVNLDRCVTAFAAVDTTSSKEASYKDLAMITHAFGVAQNEGPKSWVRVKNLVGVEALCAALSIAFDAEVWVGDIHAIHPRKPPLKARRAITGVSADPTGRPQESTSLPTERSLSPQSTVATSMALSPPYNVTPGTSISIRFEYDNSGVVAIGICEPGAAVRDYIVSKNEKRPSGSSKLAAELMSQAKSDLNLYNDTKSAWRIALAAYEMKTMRKDIIQGLQTSEDEHCKAMHGNIIKRWIGTFCREIGATGTAIKLMQTLLLKFPETDFPFIEHQTAVDALVPAVHQLAGVEEADLLSTGLEIENLSVRVSITDILIGSLFKVLFGPSYVGIELNLNALQDSKFSLAQSLVDYIPKLFQLIPAYHVPVTTYQRFSVCCSAVQSSGYVLMPRVLAEDEVNGIDSSPFIMVPGRLVRDGVPISGFYYEEEHADSDDDKIIDIKDKARIPSDASHSDEIEYFYERTEYGFKFWTVEAGHRLHLNGLIAGILSMHEVDDSYDDTAAATGWQLAAPHHSVDGNKTIYLSSKNNAARRLALSRAGDAQVTPAVHFGTNYRSTLVYANRYECSVVIL